MPENEPLSHAFTLSKVYKMLGKIGIALLKISFYMGYLGEIDILAIISCKIEIMNHYKYQ